MTERIGAIVLAGGRSSRFGRDKLTEIIDGRPLLEHAIAAVQAVATDVVVVAAPASTADLPEGVRLARDPVAFEGPLAGLAAGLAELDASIERVLVVAGDMPSLVPAVLRGLLDQVVSGADAAILAHDGDARPLPMALRRVSAEPAVRKLLSGGERRLRALTGALEAAVIDESAWRRHDPTAATLRDIDTPDDLPSP